MASLCGRTQSYRSRDPGGNQRNVSWASLPSTGGCLCIPATNAVTMDVAIEITAMMGMGFLNYLVLISVIWVPRNLRASFASPQYK